MKWFAKYFENLIVFITFLVLLHWIYQLVWGWERFWQGLVLFSLLSLTLSYQPALKLFFDNKLLLDGAFYKDKKRSFKVKWSLAYITELMGVFFLLSAFWADTESPMGDWTVWLIIIGIYLVFLTPIGICHSKVDHAKREMDKKDEEEKAKKKKASAKKKRLKKKLEKEELERQKKLEKEELAKKTEATKTQVKEILESHKLEDLNQLEKLIKKKEKLEASINKEKEIIIELNNKYPFIRKIVPNRVK